MHRSLSRQEVDGLARLARLDLTDAERDLFAHQLGEILTLAEQVQAVEDAGEPPPLDAAPAADLRADDVQPSLSRVEVLAAAPDAVTDRGLFKVPRVLR